MTRLSSPTWRRDDGNNVEWTNLNNFTTPSLSVGLKSNMQSAFFDYGRFHNRESIATNRNESWAIEGCR